MYPEITSGLAPNQIQRGQLLVSNGDYVFLDGQLYELNFRKYCRWDTKYSVKVASPPSFSPEQLKGLYPAPSESLAMRALLLCHSLDPYTKDVSHLKDYLTESIWDGDKPCFPDLKVFLLIFEPFA